MTSYRTAYVGSGPRSRPQRRLTAAQACGSPAAYDRHRYWGEVPCARCVAAMRPIWAAKAARRYARRKVRQS
jgi:hypothetical protein